MIDLYIGIDVGGTFTDGVLINNGVVLCKGKVPTISENLIVSLKQTLDQLLKNTHVSKIEKITFSTTLITNLVAEDKLDPVALLMIPGPGLNPTHWNFKTYFKVLTGMIDFRGREITPLNQTEIEEALDEINRLGYTKVVIAGKFAQRNNKHELTIAEIIKNRYPRWKIQLSHQVSGELNYPRRIATSLLTLATKEAFTKFLENIKVALKERKITAPAYILKADGGTSNINEAALAPVETIYSGPGASMLGVLGLFSEVESAIVIDIGGTTTDIGLIIDGKPLLASKGASIKEYLTHVKSFNVQAIPIGGDSAVETINGNLFVTSKRKGPAYCLGGKAVTPTDALRYLNLTNIGDLKLAQEGLSTLGKTIGLGPEIMAKVILKQMINKIAFEISEIYKKWELEPAYRIWEMKQQKKKANTIIGIGGGAHGIIRLIGEKLGCRPLVPEHSEVANAIGAAIAYPTTSVTLLIDTEQGFYSYLEKGDQQTLPNKNFMETNALELATHLLNLEVRAKGITINKDYEVVINETFNIIRGNYMVGKIILIKLQSPWQITGKIKSLRKDGLDEG